MNALTNKIILTIYSVTLLILLIISYMHFWTPYVPVKMVTSAFFVILAISLNRQNGRSPYSRSIFLVSLFFFLGDLFMEGNFFFDCGKLPILLGIITFLIGEIILLIAAIKLEKIGLLSFAGSIITIILVLIVNSLPSINLSALLIPCIIYGATIGLATSHTLKLHLCLRNKMTLYLLIGQFLFYLSDAELLLAIFSENRFKLTTLINHILYYPGVILIVISMAYDITRKTEE